jgi:hypothetical protein
LSCLQKPVWANCGHDGDKLHSFPKASNVSSTIPSTSHDSETTDSVSDSVNNGKEAQNLVSAAVRTCGVKMFTVAYDSCFISKHLFSIIDCDLCKNCLISEVPSPLYIYTGCKEHSSTVLSITYQTENKVVTIGTAVTVLVNVMSLVAHLESVELYVTGSIKKGVEFDGITKE